jgi:hypothetical protein
VLNNSPHIINLPRIFDPRGNLTFIEEDNHLPFKIQRVYWIYDVPGGEFRGSHAFRETEEIIVALSGSFDVILNNGIKKYKFQLNRSYYGIWIPKLIWRELNNFSTNSVALVIASTRYNINDYLRDFDLFLKEISR